MIAVVCMQVRGKDCCCEGHFFSYRIMSKTFRCQIYQLDSLTILQSGNLTQQSQSSVEVKMDDDMEEVRRQTVACVAMADTYMVMSVAEYYQLYRLKSHHVKESLGGAASLMKSLTRLIRNVLHDCA
ncbi:uncharacterized protein LOC131216959 [Magnolia sinica]|uniref:uncharacterized protein LOC131216959 n=1 Tax=Magnolia sinica TaxID=86752 RepID=UPI002657BFE3|nr:uncharacterized protein LOC131216959 [Magnolia sinica]